MTPFPPGLRGIGEYGYHILQGLKEQGGIEEIVVLADQVYGGPAEAEVSGVQVRRVWRSNAIMNLLSLQAHIREVDPHLVWYNIGLSMFGTAALPASLGLTAPLATKLMGYPVVVTLHELAEAVDLAQIGVSTGRLVRWGSAAMTRMLLQADAVCVTLQRYAELLQKRYGATNVVHIPHGLFDAPAPTVHVNGHREILMLAAHAPHKGLPVLLEAYQGLRRTLPGLELAIVGEDHPRFPGYLRQVAARCQELPGVRWLGYLPEDRLRDQIAAASVVALPALATTGSSSVLHRAAAAGKPVVASDLPDLRAVAEEEGLWVEFTPPGSHQALENTLWSVLSSPHRQRAMGSHNLSAARNMTLERTCARYLRLFTQLLSPLSRSVPVS